MESFIIAHKEQETLGSIGNTIIVFFSTADKITHDEINEYLQKIEEKKICNAIIVYKGAITSSAKGTITLLFETTQVTIEDFTLDEL